MQETVLIDTRGLSCPQPVLETKRAIEGSTSHRFTVLVDNVIARENVSRFARNLGFRVGVEENSSDVYQLDLERSEDSTVPSVQEDLFACPAPGTAAQVKNVVFIGHEAMGRGDDELGRRLMRGFLRTWIDCEPKPWRMIFINSGVKLTTVDDEAVEAVSMLEGQGVEVLSCGTCLEFFGLSDRLRAGRVTTMYEVIESMNAATKVLSAD